MDVLLEIINLKFITKRRFLIFSDKLSKVIEVKKVLTKLGSKGFAKGVPLGKPLVIIFLNNKVASASASLWETPCVLTKLILNFCNSKSRQTFTNKSLSFEKLKKFKLLCSRFAVRGELQNIIY